MRKYLFSLLLVLCPILCQALEESDFSYHSNNPKMRKVINSNPLNRISYNILRHTEQSPCNPDLRDQITTFWKEIKGDAFSSQEKAKILEKFLNTYQRQAHPNWEIFREYIIKEYYPKTFWDKWRERVSFTETITQEFLIDAAINTLFCFIPIVAVEIMVVLPSILPYLPRMTACQNYFFHCGSWGNRIPSPSSLHNYPYSSLHYDRSSRVMEEFKNKELKFLCHMLKLDCEKENPAYRG